MRDLTKGSIASHIVAMAGPIFCSTMTVMLWLLVDMYFVAAIGEAAVAGVGAAGSAAFLANAPLLISSSVRLITYAAPVMWLSARPYFRIEHIWYLSIATTTLQAILCLWLLHLELRRHFGTTAL
jgi:Na+-driven multidrug efflux pump